jgi:retron-type reverse transcriptase
MGTEGKRTGRKRGTPQGGVISPLLSYLFLHVVLDVWIWMQKLHPEKPFERYADDFYRTLRRLPHFKGLVFMFFAFNVFLKKY